MRKQQDKSEPTWKRRVRSKMGYAIVPPKGEPTFCEEPCNHKDCELWREFFTSKCEICGKTFEEGQRYYQIEPGRELKIERRWIHAACVDGVSE